MVGGSIHQVDAVGARASGDAGDLSDVAPLAAQHAEVASAAPPISATNVIPFVRPRRDAAATGSPADIALDPAARPAPLLVVRERRIQIVALLALSLAVHYGLYVLFNREPEPMASIGLEAISVEIVLGANMPAGLAPTPGQQEVQSAPADDPKPNPLDPDTTTVKVEDTKPAEATPVREPQRLAQTAVTEVPPEQPRSQAAETPPERPDQQHVAVLQAEETPAAREPELTATPAEPAKPEPVRTETKPEPQPKAVPKREATKKQEIRPKERPGPPTRTASSEPNPTGLRQSAASGVGPRRSQLESNYHGIVFAHLARQKRYPADAQSRGEQGRATVSFGLDGSGRVTRVSLVSGTGFASLDQEATAMVRRASPFPPPPDGRPLNFTAPVSFRVQ
jgi:periplasmic protein TonB